MKMKTVFTGAGVMVFPSIWPLGFHKGRFCEAQLGSARAASIALKGDASAAKMTHKEKSRGFEAAPGINLNFAPEKNEIVLQGDKVTVEIHGALKAWLRERYS